MIEQCLVSTRRAVSPPPPLPDHAVVGARIAAPIQRSPALDLYPSLIAAIDVLARSNGASKFTPAASTFCDRLAEVLQATRVSFGVLQGQRIQVRAISSTPNIDNNCAVVRGLENAMEEACDQEQLVQYPASSSARFVSRELSALCRLSCAERAASLPLRNNAGQAAVIVAEWETVRRPAGRDLETLALAADLATPRLLDLERAEQPSHLQIRKAVQAAINQKLGGASNVQRAGYVLLALVAFVIVFGRTSRIAQAPFELAADSRALIVAPFDGVLQKTLVRPGDPISSDQDVLAVLDDSELRLQVAEANAARFRELRQAVIHQRDNETAEEQMARARAEQFAAKIAMLEHKIAQSQVRSPITGVVVRGDLKVREGAQLRTGEVLFEVANPDELHVIIELPEDRYAEVKVGQRGMLATAADPKDKQDFVVTAIEPSAALINEHNVFRVHARVVNSGAWLKPGMRGIARIYTGRTTFLSAWTQDLTNWLRMKLWM